MRGENQVRAISELVSDVEGTKKFFEHDIRFQTEKVIGFQSIFLLRPSFPCMPVRFLSVNTALSAKLKLKKFSFLGKKQSFPILLLLSCGTQLRFRERINALLSFVSISWTLQKMIQRRRGEKRIQSCDSFNWELFRNDLLLFRFEKTCSVRTSDSWGNKLNNGINYFRKDDEGNFMYIVF